MLVIFKQWQATVENTLGNHTHIMINNNLRFEYILYFIFYPQNNIVRNYCGTVGILYNFCSKACMIMQAIILVNEENFHGRQLLEFEYKLVKLKSSVIKCCKYTENIAW